MINISKPNLNQDEETAVIKVLRSGQLAKSEIITEFEAKFAGYLGVKYAAATTSGTTALMIACQALGLKEGDEVITTPFSFIASTNCIL